jgi:putative zinc finger protein
MKQGNNNEIELLLRDLARRAPSSIAAQSRAKPSGTDQITPHLDTDELNSYVEGVLPEAARARYTAHLADCDRCRYIVAELTPLTAVSIPKREAHQESSITWWRKLAAFFSPPVLRYVVPALTVCIVVALGFVVLRQQQRAEFVAQNQPSAASTPAGQAPSESSSQSAKTQEDESRGLTSGLSGPPNRTETEPGTAQIGKSESVGDETTARNEKALSDTRSKKDTPQSSAADDVAQPSYAPEPAAPSLRREAAAGEGDKLKEEKKVQAKPQAAPEAAARMQSGSAEKTRDRNEVVETQAASPSVARGSVQSPPAEEGRASGAALAKRADNKSETRTVAGHRFKRQGNVWVDTAYESPRNVIDVKRGSEHYSALVADEPGLRSIAEQLKGEVIVLWEGRVYRIY